MGKVMTTAEYLVTKHPKDIRGLILDCERYCIDESDVVGETCSFVFEDNSILYLHLKEKHIEVETE